MKPAVVADASVAIKWVCSEALSAEAVALAGRCRLLAPELVLPECANILWKKVRRGELSPDEAVASAEVIARSPLELLPMRNLVEAATALAIEIDHPACDCVYLRIAELAAATFVTADERLVRRLRSLGTTVWSDRCIALSEAGTLH